MPLATYRSAGVRAVAPRPPQEGVAGQLYDTVTLLYEVTLPPTIGEYVGP